MQKTLSWKNNSIRYTEKGEGNTLVFLHGFAESLDIWNAFSEQLSDSYRIICIDLPGHGGSSSIGEMHTMDEMADCVNAVLGETEKCIMTGHSMGGYVTLAFAEKYPEKLNGICLFHSSALPDSEEKKADRLRTVEAVKQDKRKFISALIPNLFSKNNREKLQQEIDRMIRLGEKTPSEGVTAALLGMRARPDRVNILKQVRFPVLFLPGQQDELIPLGVVLRQSMMPSKSLTVVLQNSGHMGFIEDKEEALVILRHFCEMCLSR